MKTAVSPGIVLVLTESLSLYWRIVKSKWPSLLAVAASCQLLQTLFRCIMRKYCEMDCRAALVFEAMAGIAMCCPLVLVSVVIVVDRAMGVLSGGRSPESGGIVAAWKRALATSFLWVFVIYACGFAAYFAVSAISPATILALRSVGLDATANSTVRYFAALAPAGLQMATFVFFSWLLTQCLFSVPLSIIRPLAGTAAMSASLKLTKGSFWRSLDFAANAYFVPVGIGAVPGIIAIVIAGYGPIPVMASSMMSETAFFVAGVIQLLAFPFCYVASLMFIQRTEDHSVPQKESAAGRSSFMLWVFVGCSFSVFIGSVDLIKYAAKNIREGATFKSFFVADVEVVHDISQECRFAETLREENGKFFVDSPFDLRIGSTGYARQIGDCGGVYLTKPYHGLEQVGLNFAKSDKKLASIFASKGLFEAKFSQMSMSECRAEVSAIAADMCERLRIDPGTLKITDEGDEEALAYVEGAKKRGKENREFYALNFYGLEAKLRIDGQIVSYRVWGLIHADTGKCSVQISIGLERPRAIK